MVAITKEEGLKEAKKLVEKFELNEDLYKNDKYNEEQLKTEFLNPFFKALGWDVNNQQDAAPQFKEVIFEDSIKVGKETKAPDYSFRIGGQRIFFLEAKKPSRDIKNDKDHAFQVRRYGWSAQLKGSILSDFEELAIYETQTKPELNQSASISRLKYYNYKEYVEKWDEIWDLFSKEAVMKGKFNKFFKSEKKLKGTTTVDEEFLKEINQWRELLARNIALRNELLSESELNYAVQLTIDRIIFLRMAEDRGIIKYRTLYNLLDKDNIYEAFGELCLKADLKYNSGLFHFSPESKDDDGVDTFTLDLTIDDNVFKKILKNLYYPNSPYEFSMISPEILGNVYEQFLGKVITLTKGHRAKVIEKPEVKKAGGVYYTPNFIVKYIVENTVGELLKGKTPNKVSKMKILDPSCGSGSFLLEAYQFLLDWHLDYYTGLKKPPKNVIFQARNGEWLLTIQEKKRILLNNIYGVDLDENAVEVTKLSLLLKVLENQNKDSLEAQQKLTVERVLPNLKDNIKCGNSLIEYGIIDEDISHDDIMKIRPFKWEDEFPKIISNGGFDAVIGNPPYVSVETMDELSKNYYKKNYDTFVKRSDLFNVFLEQSLNKISKNYVSFIIPSIIFSNISYKKIRNLILDNNYLKEICYTGQNVFKGVTVDTTILILSKSKNQNIKLINARDFNNKLQYVVKNDYFKKFDNVLSVDDRDTVKILDKLFVEEYDNVKDNFNIFQGIVTGKNNAFLFSSEEEALKKNIEKELLKPVCNGKDINQWEIENTENRILYLNNDYYINDYPNAKDWLSNFRKDLKNRRECKNGAISWYSLQWPRKKEELDLQEKILIQATRNEKLKRRLVATIDKNGIYATQGIFFVIPKTEKYSLYFLLAILNSNLLNYLFATKFLNLGIKKDYLNKISFPKLSLKDQEIFIEMAKKMLNLHEKLLKVNSPLEKNILEKEINFLNQKINKKVYELYGLTDDEIKIIEDSLK